MLILMMLKLLMIEVNMSMRGLMMLLIMWVVILLMMCMMELVVMLMMVSAEGFYPFVISVIT